MISTKFLQPAKQNQNQNKKKSESWFFWQKTHQPTKQEPSFFAKKTPSKLISLANARSLRMLLGVLFSFPPPFLCFTSSSLTRQSSSSKPKQTKTKAPLAFAFLFSSLQNLGGDGGRAAGISAGASPKEQERPVLCAWARFPRHQHQRC